MEEFRKEEKIIEKSENEKQLELVIHILKTKKALEEATKNFEFAEGDLIDYYTYQIKANRAKLDYLVKSAKEIGLELDMISQMGIRYNEAI